MTDSALVKMRLSERMPKAAVSFSFLQKVWEQEQMLSFKDFLCWCNNEDVVPILKATQKMVELYHKKSFDMLKLGCTLPNLANNSLHISTSA